MAAVAGKSATRREARAEWAHRLPVEFFSVAEVARLLSLSEHAVRARVARHQLPFRKLGGRVVFRQSELLDFLDKLGGCSVAEALANATSTP